MSFLATLLAYCGAAAAVILVFERGFSVLLWWLAPILPNDMAGDDGWFLDTRNGQGIFDRRLG